MKKPAVIITDPAEATRRCLSQRPVSHEEAVESIREPKPSQALSEAWESLSDSEWFKAAYEGQAPHEDRRNDQ